MRRRLATLLLLAAASAWALDTGETEALFREGNDLFRQANQLSVEDPGGAYDLYRSAALRYERIAGEGGVKNGRLLYNLGNAYFRMGDLGRAILNYRRAELFIPGDPNLRQNLNFARSRRLDRLEDQTGTRVLKTLLFWHYDLSPALRLSIFALFWTALWVGLAIRLLRPSLAPRPALILTGVLAGCFLASLAAESFGAQGERHGVIIAPETTALKGDGESYEPAFTEPLHAGAEYRLLEERSGWLQIELPDGRTAWVRERDAETVEAEL